MQWVDSGIEQELVSMFCTRKGNSKLTAYEKLPLEQSRRFACAL